MDSVTPRPSTLESNPGLLILGGIVTLAAVLLSYGAFDDITTDNSTSFTFEYLVLMASAAWCLFVALRFWMRKQYLPGMMSLIMLLAAVWGQRVIGPGTVPNLQPEYIATVASLAWFLILSLVLIVVGFRRLI